MWHCPAGHGIPIRQGHGYLEKVWNFSDSCVLVFGLKIASCIFISSRDRVTCTILVLGALSEMLHASWPTGFMSLCIDSDLGCYSQLNGLACVSFWSANKLWLLVCEMWCLLQCANSLYGWLDVNIPLLAKLFTPFSHAKIRTIYLESACVTPASWWPLPLPQIPATSLQRNNLLCREQRPKTWLGQTGQQNCSKAKKILFPARPNMIHNVCGN